MIGFAPSDEQQMLIDTVRLTRSAGHMLALVTLRDSPMTYCQAPPLTPTIGRPCHRTAIARSTG